MMALRNYWHFSVAKKISIDVEPNVISCNMHIILVNRMSQNNTPRRKQRKKGRLLDRTERVSANVSSQCYESIAARPLSMIP